MIDHWFGRILDQLDEQELWDDTAVVLCTDHGHYLGERDAFGKPGIPIWSDLGNTPLLVAWPGVEPRTVDALTTNVDLHATLADAFGVQPTHRTHGHSLVPLLEGKADTVRDHLLLGMWGRHVQVVGGDRHYARAPVADNFPLAMWSNRWSTMPTGAELRLPRPDRRAQLAFMPGSEVPVIRQPFGPGDHLLHDLDADPWQTENRAGSAAEADAIDLLRVALDEVDAPAEQYERLGLA